LFLIRKLNSDVAGNEEAKLELKEVVKFLTDPDSFLNLEQAYPKEFYLEDHQEQEHKATAEAHL
jgi:ATP-dependent Zn protease